MLGFPQRILLDELNEQELIKTNQCEQESQLQNQQLAIDQSNDLLKRLVKSKAKNIQKYFDKNNQEENGIELGFSSVGSFDTTQQLQDDHNMELMKFLQPGFIFEVVVIEKLKQTRELIVVLQRFLAFSDRCYSSAFKHHDADFSLFSKHRNSLNALIKVNTMNIKGIIDDSEVIEDFSCFAYYISFNKIQVGDHLNAVILYVDPDFNINKPILQMSLKNKCLLGGKMWSLVNLQDPRTLSLATPISFRLGFTRMIGKSIDQNIKTEVEKQKQVSETNKIIQFKQEFGVFSLHYQIQNDVFFLNKQNYDLMLKSLKINQFHSLCNNNNLDDVQSINLDYKRRIYYIKIYIIQIKKLNNILTFTRLSKLSSGSIIIYTQPIQAQKNNNQKQ